MLKKLRIDFNKNNKLKYYSTNVLRVLIPDFFYQKNLKKLLEIANNNKVVQKRLNYYNKLQKQFILPDDAITISQLKKEEKTTYFFDLLSFLKYFDSNLRFSYLFGDITHIPDYPAFVKSRPILSDNQNSVLMNLNKVRHFIFLNDKINFKDKKDKIVWRGSAYVPHREAFVKKFYNHALCDVGQTNKKGDLTVPWQKKKMTISEQLKYKFIFVVEGNDVASNLKWAMSSNSLVFMIKPKYETWFMEGELIGDYHYVLLKDDYSDIEEKIAYYSKNIKEAKEIVENANNHVNQFKDNKIEKLVSISVINKYFEKIVES